MANHPALDRMALPPPPAATQRRTAYNREAPFIFTPTAFVISVIVATLAIAALMTLFAGLPEIARIVLVATGLAGILVFRLVALYTGWDPRSAARAVHDRERGRPPETGAAGQRGSVTVQPRIPGHR